MIAFYVDVVGSASPTSVPTEIRLAAQLTDEEVDVVWGPVTRGPATTFVILDDPAGHHIELSAEMEKFHDDRVTYAARRWEPVPSSVNL